MKISSVTIVGNDLDLWITAAIFSRKLPHFKVNVIDLQKELIDQNITTDEVFSIYSHLIGIQDSDWKTNTNAVYKAGVEYYNFEKDSHYFCIPNGLYDIPKEEEKSQLNLGILYDLKNYFSKDITHKDLLNFMTYCPWLIAQNRISKSFKTTEKIKAPFRFEDDITFSFEKNLFIEVLKKQCKSAITVYENSKPEVIRNEDGSIQTIQVGTTSLYSDLYIDVSSDSILAEENNEFNSIEYYHEDTKNTFSLTYESTLDQVKNVKLASSVVATEYGFAKKIPAWERCSFEYFYNSNETDSNEIEKIIEKTFAQEIEHSHQKIQTGCHRVSWSKNVLLLGQAYYQLNSKIIESHSLLIDNLLYLLNIIDEKVDHYNCSVYNNHCYKNFFKSIQGDLIFNSFSSRKGKFWEHYNTFEYYSEAVEYNLFNLLSASHENLSPKDLYLLLGFDVPLFNSKFQTNVIAERNKDFVKFLDYLKFGYQRFMEEMFEEVKTFENVHDYTVANIYS